MPKSLKKCPLLKFKVSQMNKIFIQICFEGDRCDETNWFFFTHHQRAQHSRWPSILVQNRSWHHIYWYVIIHIALNLPNRTVFYCNICLYNKVGCSRWKCWDHDDVIKWKHFPRYWPFVRGIHRSPVNSPHKGQRRGALMFSLISARINGWVNNREAGDLRRIRRHYDVAVTYMAFQRPCSKCQPRKLAKIQK